jgi:hypothetical protein
MEATNHGERTTDEHSICRLEWIAWAIEAARRHKEAGQAPPPPKSPRTELRLVAVNE